LGGEFQVNSYTMTTQFYPSLAVDGDGDFVVAWSSRHDGFEYGIFARRFNAAGTPQGVEFQVNSHTTSEQRRPTVAIGAQGSFVVAWQSFAQDGDVYGIFAQRFDSAGAPQATELQVNIVTAGFQVAPDLATDTSGGFVVTWHSFLQDGSSYGIFGRMFNAAGAPLAGDFQVNTYTAGSQRFSAVGLRGGDFVVAWHSEAQDGSLEGVFAQRFATIAILDIDGNGTTAPLTDGLLVLRFLFGFSGSTLTSGAVGQGCTRCDAAAIVPYLQTLV
jgi:hypothetical protein